MQELLERVISLSDQTRTSQKQLGTYCGRSQAHMSKVLRGKTPLTKSVATKLKAWIAEQPGPAVPNKAEVEALIEGFAAAPPQRKKHIMHILQELSALV